MNSVWQNQVYSQQLIFRLYSSRDFVRTTVNFLDYHRAFLSNLISSCDPISALHLAIGPWLTPEWPLIHASHWSLVRGSFYQIRRPWAFRNLFDPKLTPVDYCMTFDLLMGSLQNYTLKLRGPSPTPMPTFSSIFQSTTKRIAVHTYIHTYIHI